MDFDDDNTDNNIYTILVDHMVKGEVSIYIVYNDCTMKRFTSKIKGSDLLFEEYPHTYSFLSYFKKEEPKIDKKKGELG